MELDNLLDIDRRALGIKQPWVELILRGIKTLEIRSLATNVRGPIYLYASRRQAAEPHARRAAEQHRVLPDELITGMIVGSVHLIDCRPVTPRDASAACLPEEMLQTQYAWVLTHPQRFSQPRPVQFLPYGVWFYPYKRRKHESW